MTMEKPVTLEDWKEIGEHHFVLCEKLHNLNDDLSKNVKDQIWDDVYMHFEP